MSEKVRTTTFTDAKNSYKDIALLGPPSVEFAPYGRVPSSRPRKDARQGTIDQDPEFIDFLESLTNPVSKSTTADHENDSVSKGKEKVTVTPLIQFLRDKKANKSKENASTSKSSKHARQESKDSKPVLPDNKTPSSSTLPASPKKRSAQAVKVEQAAREAVKVLNKQAANSNKAKETTTQPLPAPVKAHAVTPDGVASAALADKRRERGNASAAARILQRDLGIGSIRGGRRGGLSGVTRNVTSNALPNTSQSTGMTQASTATGSETSTNVTIADPVSSKSTNADMTKSPPLSTAPTGPAASRLPPKAPAPAHLNAVPRAPRPPSNVTQAFLKHANPSQGITEPLLEEAFAAFGKIVKVEIDKKKGFAYIDFEEAESLQKAIKASPIKVAQGQVVVLERKTGTNLQARNIRGGPMMMNRGGSMPLGGRGGPARGRDGFIRGGSQMQNSNQVKSSPIPPLATVSPGPAAAPSATSEFQGTSDSAATE